MLSVRKARSCTRCDSYSFTISQGSAIALRASIVTVDQTDKQYDAIGEKRASLFTN